MRDVTTSIIALLCQY